MTPNMNAIAGAGVRFRRAYTPCPTCIAARRSILSGQFPATHGMMGYRDGVEWDITETLPALLSRAGYHTCWIGRSMHQHPFRKRFGFQQVVLSGGRHGPSIHAPTEYAEFLARNQPEGGGGYYGSGVMHNDWTARPWHLPEQLHHTNCSVGEALRWLERRDPPCPFFLVVSFIAAHPPLVPPAFYLERYLRTGAPDPIVGDWATPPAHDGIGDDVSASSVDLSGEALLSARAGYYGLLNHLDDQLRRLLNPVNDVERQTGHNTVVMLTSDHGDMLGDHHLWRKTVPYEPSARIPLLVRGPGHLEIQRGAVRNEPVSLPDIMPTLLDMADVPIPDTVEGRSLLPLLRGEQPPWREQLHIEHAPMHHTLTDGHEKYIWFVKDGREQFFDLVADPTECHDLTGDPQAADRIATWRERMIVKLRDRPEGFSDGRQLVPGVAYAPVFTGPSA